MFGCLSRSFLKRKGRTLSDFLCNRPSVFSLLQIRSITQFRLLLLKVFTSLCKTAVRSSNDTRRNLDLQAAKRNPVFRAAFTATALELYERSLGHERSAPIGKPCKPVVLRTYPSFIVHFSPRNFYQPKVNAFSAGSIDLSVLLETKLAEFKGCPEGRSTDPILIESERRKGILMFPAVLRGAACDLEELVQVILGAER